MTGRTTRWFIDEHCIACGLCAELMPSMVHLDLDAGVYSLVRQPDVPLELEAVKRTARECPVAAVNVQDANRGNP
jgi:ferredoxin